MKAIIVDIDNTLANNDHRQHYVTGKGKKDWKGFFSKIPDDTVNEWCRELMRAMESIGYKIIIVTARADNHKQATLEWLSVNDINYDEIYFRKGGDCRDDTIIKGEIFINYIKDNFKVAFIVDDRASVVKMWRGMGLTVLDCKNNTF